MLRGGSYFGGLLFVPIMRAPHGALRADLQRPESLRSPLFEGQFSDIVELEAACALLAWQQARLWVNAIEMSDRLHFNDRQRAAHPDAVWDRLLDAIVGAIRSDSISVLVDYVM